MPGKSVCGTDVKHVKRIMTVKPKHNYCNGVGVAEAYISTAWHRGSLVFSLF